MYTDRTTENLRFMLWANLQSVLRLDDIIDRSNDEEHRQSVIKHRAELQQECDAIRAELNRRA